MSRSILNMFKEQAYVFFKQYKIMDGISPIISHLGYLSVAMNLERNDGFKGSLSQCKS